MNVLVFPAEGLRQRQFCLLPGFLLLLVLAFFLTGCHKTLLPGVLDDPGWSYSPISVPAGEMSDQVVASLTAGVDSLDVTIMRRLILARHPAVLAAEALVNETAARNKVAGRLPNPEFESRLIYNDGRRTRLESGLMFSLPINGRLGAASHVSAADLALAEGALRETRKQAILELKGALIRLEGARERLVLNEELAARSNEYADLARTRLSASIADPLDVSLVLADAASDKRALTRSRAEAARIETALRLLLGLMEQYPAIKTPKLESVGTRPEKDFLRAMARQHSESVLRARLKYQRAAWKARLASRERVPDLRLGPTLEFEEDASSAGVAFSLPVPFFNTGTAEYKASLAHRDAAYMALDFEIRAVNSRLTTVLDHLASLDAELVDLTGEVVAAVSEAFDLAEGRYRAGRIDVLHLLSAHRTYASVQFEIIDVTVARHEALFELESVVGCSLHESTVSRQPEVRP